MKEIRHLTTIEKDVDGLDEMHNEVPTLIL